MSTTFVRQNLVDSVVKLLKGIGRDGAYNTLPYVTQDPREVVGRQEAFILLVMPSGETVVEVEISGRLEMEMVIDVYGYAQTKSGNPVKSLNLLLQDVRNMLHQNVDKISDDADRGLAFRLGDLETDEGILAQDGQAAFVQSTHFVYKNGSTW
jgi:hypothetical protein